MIKTHLSLVLVDGFFAIHLSKIIIIMKKSHNPYFNRWFSAMEEQKKEKEIQESHNPYFNRWFSAIQKEDKTVKKYDMVTILILIDGFLQYRVKKYYKNYDELSQSLF